MSDETGMAIEDTITSNLDHAHVGFKGAVEEDVLNTAIKALAFAKEQASWTDRTGNARAELDTEVYWDGQTIVWELYHGVEYGKWLETIYSGKFAVIMPTLELFAPQVGRGLSEKGVISDDGG
jgi:hypothetical protein